MLATGQPDPARDKLRRLRFGRTWLAALLLLLLGADPEPQIHLAVIQSSKPLLPAWQAAELAGEAAAVVLDYVQELPRRDASFSLHLVRHLMIPGMSMSSPLCRRR